MNCRSVTLLLSSFLLLPLFPLFTRGSSLSFNSTQFSSSHVLEKKPASPGKVIPASSSQIHVHKRRAAEEAGSSGRAEHGPSRSGADSFEQELRHPGDMVVGGMGAGLPTLSHGQAQLDFKEENSEAPAPRWHGKVLQPDGRIVDLDSRFPPHERSVFLSGQDDSSSSLKVSFSTPDHQHQIKSPPQEVQGGDPTSWTLHDFYDYLSPDYSTTESYADDDRSTPSDMEDENIQRPGLINSQTSRLDDGASGRNNRAGALGAAEGGAKGGSCLLGFIHRNGTCHSPCDDSTTYCFNGGQCYVLEGIGALCRCNLQDYMWNKGSRCESVITEFQVMCIVVSGVSVMLLVFFMLIVFFSKRLHLLKMENQQLRKHSKSRPQSEQLNDNFSVSTVAEGSQANVRNGCGSPSNPPPDLAFYDNVICQKTVSKDGKPTEESCSQNDTAKPEDPIKTPVKEDESLTIQNSVTLQHENNAVSANDPEESGVTIDLELLLPNEAKTRPESSPPLHYNVFLYKLPKSPKLSPGRSRQGKVFPQVRPRRGSEPGYSPMSSRTPNPRLGKACTP